MNERQKILELLTWVKGMGLWPEKFKDEDLFVIPIANTICRWDQIVNEHQREMALWIPNQEALNLLLKKRGLQGIELFEQDGIHFAEVKTAGRIRGVGLGKTEALLSALNRMRRTALAA